MHAAMSTCMPPRLHVVCMQGATFLAFSVPNAVAGALMGKGASTLTAMRTATGAAILVSHQNDTVPRTTDRIVTIAGTHRIICHIT